MEREREEVAQQRAEMDRQQEQQEADKARHQ
eukprot:COSAG01_NODE_1708_length_9425_cov_5.499893_11_plen_31_part_00